jgi:uncharacterized membrane protein YesL
LQPVSERQPDQFSQIISVVTTFVAANMLWVICSLPVITMPAATAGLFAVMVTWVRGESVEPLSVFFDGMRQHWRSSTLLMLGNLVIAGLAAANVLILRQMDMGQVPMILSGAVTILLSTFTVVANVYAWPLLIASSDNVTTLVQNAVRLGFAHLDWTLLVIMLAVIPLVLSLFVPQAVFLIGSFSASGLIVSWGAWQMIRRYFDVGNLDKFGA